MYMNRLCSLLVYDIPEASKIQNPSNFLRRRAVRINLSCWVIPNDRIPYTRLEHMARAGASWHVVKFDESEAQKLAQLAISTLIREIKAVVESARNTEAKADRAQTPEQRRAYWAKVRGSLYRARIALRDAKDAAKAFGLDPASMGVGDATQEIYTLQVIARRKALAHVRAAEKIEHDGIRNGLAADLPGIAGVAADYLEESGECELAEELR